MRSLFIFLMLMVTFPAYALEITSDAFGVGESIPSEYTCDGTDISPPLAFGDIPDGAESLVLICDDPDAPVGTWVHWVLFNIPADTKGLMEDIPKNQGLLSDYTVQGKNDFGNIGYGGPCPPKSEAHRYFFKLYALDTKLDLAQGATKQEVEDAMAGHIVDQAYTVGLYAR